MLAVTSAGIACALIFALVLTISSKRKRQYDDDSDDDSDSDLSDDDDESSDEDEAKPSESDADEVSNPYGLSSASLGLGLSSVKIVKDEKKKKKEKTGKRAQKNNRKLDPRDVRRPASGVDLELDAMRVTDNWERSVTHSHKATPPRRTVGSAKASSRTVRMPTDSDGDDNQAL